MRRRARPGGGRQVEITIRGIGARGDGYASVDGELVFVPFTVAGDRVTARITGQRAGGAKAEVVELLSEGPGRAEPPCPHFGPCGGCALQHLADAHYADWKAALLAQALAHRGFADVEIRPMVRVPPGTRRRATLAAVKRDGKVRLGFHGRESHTVVDVSTCLLLTPALAGLLPPMRALLSEVLADGETAAAVVTETAEGPDVFIASPLVPGHAAREKLAAFAAAADVARLSWAETPREGGIERASQSASPVVIRRPPRILFGGVAVEPPPGAFLQPTVAGETALTEAVLRYLPEGWRRVADLFCGIGTFTFPMVAQGWVFAADGVDQAIAAVWGAARRAGLTARVAVEARDLARAPLVPDELARFDAVVFDPPRAGAREQAAALAGSKVPTVIAVSCSPNSFARDARLLVNGGYRLVEVTPVDQFPWSGHLELVAQFRRQGPVRVN